MGNGIFGDLFDFNRDGKLDAFEQAADFMTFDRMVSEVDDSDETDDDDDYEEENDDDDDETDDIDSDDDF